MRVQIPSRLSVDEPDDVPIFEVDDGFRRVVFRSSTIWVEEPIVVGILMMVASDLLLTGALRIGLDVRMEQSATISHIFQGCARPIRNLQRTVLSNLRPAKIRLEQRAHLSITRSSVRQYEEVKVKGEEVDDHWDHNQSYGSGSKVCSESELESVNLTRRNA